MSEVLNIGSIHILPDEYTGFTQHSWAELECILTLHFLNIWKSVYPPKVHLNILLILEDNPMKTILIEMTSKPKQ